MKAKKVMAAKKAAKPMKKVAKKLALTMKSRKGC